VGNKMPAWVTAGFQDYVKRFSRAIRIQLIEIPLEKRSKQTHLTPLIERESEKLIAHTHSSHLIIALERSGAMWSTDTLSLQLQKWQHAERGVDLLIGGPDGLSAACLKHAQLQWSLSPLTLPHPLVRLILIEQLYRAESILNHHPYHRG